MGIIENEQPATNNRLGKTVVALGFVSLFTDIASEMVYTQIPIFLTQVLLAPRWVVGLIEGVAESTASLMKLLSGWLSDRSQQRKPLAVAGYSLGAFSKPLLFLAVGWFAIPCVFFIRFLDRLGKGLRTAPRDALIAETTPLEIRGRAFGLHRTMDTTGAVIGPLLGIWFLTHVSSNLRYLFLFAGIPGILAVLTILFFVNEKKRSPSALEITRQEVKAAYPRFKWSSIHPDYRRFLLITTLFNIGNSSDAFLILRASSIGFKNIDLLWLYAAFNVVEAALGYAAGHLSDKVGRKPLLIAGYAIFSVVYLGFALVMRGSFTAVWGLFLLYGGYYTLTQGTQRAFAADFADPKQRAAQIGAFHAVVGISLLPASIIAGILFTLNRAAPFYLGSATALLSAVLMLTLSGKKEL